MPLEAPVMMAVFTSEECLLMVVSGVGRPSPADRRSRRRWGAPWFYLGKRDFDLHVAADRLGVRASGVGCIYHGLGDTALHAGQAHVQPRLQRVTIAAHTQVNFGFDCVARRER